MKEQKLTKAQIKLVRDWLISCGATEKHLEEFDKMVKDYLSGKIDALPLWKIIKMGD